MISRQSDEVAKLAMEIADAVAASEIRSFCVRDWMDPLVGDWYDTTKLMDWTDTAIVQRAVRYLELQGRLTRHPEHFDLVQINEVPS